MSSLALITGPVVDPVSLGEAKAQCRISSADEDGLVAGFLLAARSHCEDYTGRVFMTQTWEAKFDGDWPTVFDSSCMRRRVRVMLPNPPAQSIASVSYIDTTGTLQVLASNQYTFSKGDIFGFLEPAYGVSWPTVRQQLETVTVRYVAGYGPNPGDLPEPIRQAILMLVSHFDQNREAVMADTRAAAIELPFGVRALLSSYMTEGW